MKAKIYTLYGFGVALGVTAALCGIFGSGASNPDGMLVSEAVAVVGIAAGLVLCAFGEKLANKQDGEKNAQTGNRD